MQLQDERVVQASPVARLLARHFDFALATALTGFLFVPLVAPLVFVASDSAEGGDTYRAYLMVAVVLITLIAQCLDALIYRSFGATPGKWLLGIRVVGANGENASTMRYWMRNMRMAGSAMGAGVLAIGALTHAYQWQRLARKGATSYDATLGTSVIQAPDKARPLLYVAAVIGVVAALVAAGIEIQHAMG